MGFLCGQDLLSRRFGASFRKRSKQVYLVGSDEKEDSVILHNQFAYRWFDWFGMYRMEIAFSHHRKVRQDLRFVFSGKTFNKFTNSRGCSRNSTR